MMLVSLFGHGPCSHLVQVQQLLRCTAQSVQDPRQVCHVPWLLVVQAGKVQEGRKVLAANLVREVDCDDPAAGTWAHLSTHCRDCLQSSTVNWPWILCQILTCKGHAMQKDAQHAMQGMQNMSCRRRVSTTATGDVHNCQQQLT